MSTDNPILRYPRAKKGSTTNKTRDFWIRFFLPGVVSIALSLWLMYFALLHPAVIAIFFSAALAPVVAPVLLLMAGLAANWWLYKHAVPNTYFHAHHLLREIKKRFRSAGSIFDRAISLRVLGLVCSITYPLLLAPILYTSLSSMLGFYLTKLAVLIGFGALANPIVIIVLAASLSLVVLITTVCLLFDSFDSQVRLWTDKANKKKRKRVIKDIKTIFTKQANESTALFLFRMSLTVILLAGAVVVAFLAILATLGVAAPAMLHFLMVYLHASKLVGSIIVGVLAFGMSLPGRLPFQIRSMQKAARYIVFQVTHPLDMLFSMSDNLRKRGWSVRKACAESHGAIVVFVFLIAVAQQFIWPVIKGIITALNTLCSYCMGISGSSNPLTVALRIEHAVAPANAVFSTIVTVDTANQAGVKGTGFVELIKMLSTKVKIIVNNPFGSYTKEDLNSQLLILKYYPNSAVDYLSVRKHSFGENWNKLAGSIQSVNSSLDYKLYAYEALVALAGINSDKNFEGFYLEPLKSTSLKGEMLNVYLSRLRVLSGYMGEEQLTASWEAVRDRLKVEALASNNIPFLRATAIAIMHHYDDVTRHKLYDSSKKEFEMYQGNRVRAKLHNGRDEIDVLLRLSVLANSKNEVDDVFDMALDVIRADEHASECAPVLDSAWRVIDLLLVEIESPPVDFFDLIEERLYLLADDKSKEQEIVIPLLRNIVAQFNNVPSELVEFVLYKLKNTTEHETEYLEILRSLLPKINTTLKQIQEDNDEQARLELAYPAVSLLSLFNFIWVQREDDKYLDILAELPAKILSEQQISQRFIFFHQRQIKLVSDAGLDEGHEKAVKRLVKSIEGTTILLFPVFNEDLEMRHSDENNKLSVLELESLREMTPTLRAVSDRVFRLMMNTFINGNAQQRQAALQTLLRFMTQISVDDFKPLLTEEQKSEIKELVLDFVDKWDKDFVVTDFNRIYQLAELLQENTAVADDGLLPEITKKITRLLEPGGSATSLIRKSLLQCLLESTHGRRLIQDDKLSDIIRTQINDENEQTINRGLALLALEQGNVEGKKQFTSIAEPVVLMRKLFEYLNSDGIAITEKTQCLKSIHGLIYYMKGNDFAERASLQSALLILIKNYSPHEAINPVESATSAELAEQAANTLIVLQTELKNTSGAGLVVETDLAQDVGDDNPIALRLRHILLQLEDVDVARQKLYEKLVDGFNDNVRKVNQSWTVGPVAGLSFFFCIGRQDSPATLVAVREELEKFFIKSPAGALPEISSDKDKVTDDDIYELVTIMQAVNKLYKDALNRRGTSIFRHHKTESAYKESIDFHERHLASLWQPTQNSPGIVF